MAVPSPGEASPEIDYERFFERAVDVFVVTGPDGHFRQVNPALAELLGVPRERILAEPWSAFVHPDDRERSAEENAREFAAGHRTVTFENRYLDIDGGVHWMDWNAKLALQGDERTRAIPVLILSADATAGQVDRLLARGARAYMTKPFDVRAFLALVDEHLGGSSGLSG